MEYYVYVLWSDRLQKRYVGFSEHPDIRLQQHNNGLSRFTSSGIPWVLRYKEKYATKQEALRRERILKSGCGRFFLDKLTCFTDEYPEKELPSNCLEYKLYVNTER